MNDPALLVQTLVDNNADGTPESITSTTYSTEGNILKTSSDADADGQTDSVTTYTYNANGDQTGLFLDFDNDSTPEYTYTSDYAVDASGNLTVTSVSGGPSTSRDVTYVSVFDSSGNFIREATDVEGDGLETTATYAYNESNQITLITLFETDSLRGSDYTRTFSYTYDEIGRVVSDSARSTFVSVFPGSSSEYTYDESGNLVTRTYETGGFISDIIYNYAYDEANKLIELTTAFASSPDFFLSTQRYDYNEAAQVTRYEYATEAVGVGSEGFLYTYSYDEAGNFIQETFDRGNDGSLDSITQYGYDEAGNFIRETLDSNGDGSPDFITQYSYDAANRVTSESIDEDGDGVFDSITTYVYDDLLIGGSANLSLSSSEDIVSSLENTSTLLDVKTSEQFVMI